VYPTGVIITVFGIFAMTALDVHIELCAAASCYIQRDPSKVENKNKYTFKKKINGRKFIAEWFICHHTRPD